MLIFYCAASAPQLIRTIQFQQETWTNTQRIASHELSESSYEAIDTCRRAAKRTNYRQIIDIFGKLCLERWMTLILSLPCMRCLSWTANPIICLVFCICWPKGWDGSCQNRCQPHDSAPVAPGCWSAASQPACWNLSDAARPFGTSDPAGRPVTAATRKGHWILWLCPARDASIAKTPQHRKTSLYSCSLKGIQLGPGPTHCLDFLIATNLGCWSIIKRKGCLKIEDWQDPQNPFCLETPWSNSWFWIFMWLLDTPAS